MTKEEIQIQLGIDSGSMQGGLINANSIIVKSLQSTAKSLVKLFSINFTQLVTDGLRQWNTLTKTLANSIYDTANISGRVHENNRRADRAALIAAREAEKEAAKAQVERQKLMEKTAEMEDKVTAGQFAARLEAAKTEEARNTLLTEHLAVQREIAQIEADQVDHYRNSFDLEKRQLVAFAALKLQEIEKEIAAEDKRHAAVLKSIAAEKAAKRTAALDAQITTMEGVNRVGAKSIYDERIRRLGNMANEAKAGGEAGRFYNLQNEMRRMQGMTPEAFAKETLVKNTDLLQNLVDAVSKSGIKLLPSP